MGGAPIPRRPGSRWGPVAAAARWFHVGSQGAESRNGSFLAEPTRRISLVSTDDAAPYFMDPHRDGVRVTKFLSFASPFILGLGREPELAVVRRLIRRVILVWNFGALKHEGLGDALDRFGRDIMFGSQAVLDGVKHVLESKEAALPDDHWFIMEWAVVPDERRGWRLTMKTTDPALRDPAGLAAATAFTRLMSTREGYQAFSDAHRRLNLGPKDKGRRHPRWKRPRRTRRRP